ncbi:amidohydrolase family protein [Candidatus Poribacteria bacterium]
MSRADSDSYLYPHSPDVLERETADDGFSSGWGLHFQTSERYWIDCHVHARRGPDFQERVNDWFEWSRAWRQAQFIAIDGRPDSSGNGFSYEELAEIVKEDDRLAFLYYPGIDTPDVEPLEHALELGARGLKLWSPTFVLEGRPADEFEHPKWEGVFKIVNDRRLPILWHVTQRITDSPYTGGGRNAYWGEGWKKGVTYTNEDLLQSFLRVAKAHPDGHFIGAHQLHVGWDRLEEIFAEHPNVYIDTSIGCFVRWGDTMYPEDQEKLREFFIKYADRILFGTDIGMGEGYNLETEHLSLMGHIRFVRQLRLPYDELQKVSHQNSEKLFRLEPSSDVRMGNIRP